MRGFKRLTGDLLTVGGILLAMTIAAFALVLVVAVVIMLIALGPGWELGPGD